MEALPRREDHGPSAERILFDAEAATRIPPHTGVTNTRAIIHLPLIVPEGCGFRVGGETRPWVVGKPFAFDDTIEHEAWNDSDELRAVLIFDVWNPHLTEREQDVIARYYAAADAAATIRTWENSCSCRVDFGYEMTAFVCGNCDHRARYQDSKEPEMRFVSMVALGLALTGPAVASGESLAAKPDAVGNVV